MNRDRRMRELMKLRDEAANRVAYLEREIDSARAEKAALECDIASLSLLERNEKAAQRGELQAVAIVKEHAEAWGITYRVESEGGRQTVTLLEAEEVESHNEAAYVAVMRKRG